MDTLKPCAKRTHIHIRLTRDRKTFKTEALVVYVSPGLGMGIHFDERSVENQLIILDRWLGEAARNP